MKSVGDDLGCQSNSIQKHEEEKALKYYQYKSKGVRLNIVLHDSYQVDEIFMEIEERKQTLLDN